MKSSDSLNYNKIKKIICLVDTDKINDIRELEKIKKLLSITPENYSIIGYKKKKIDNSVEDFPIYTYKDISLKGDFLNQEIKKWKSVKYDVLINYFDEPKTELLFLSSEIKSKLRVGLNGIDEVFNDIIINCDISKQNLFVSELEKILQTLK